MSPVSFSVLSVPDANVACLLDEMMNKVGAPPHEARVRWRWRIACPRQDWAWRLIAHDRGLDLVGGNEKRPKIRGDRRALGGSLIGSVKSYCGLGASCLLELRHLGLVTWIIDDGFRDGPHDYPACHASRNECRSAAWLFAAIDDFMVDVEIAYVGADCEAIAVFAAHAAHDSAGAVARAFEDRVREAVIHLLAQTGRERVGLQDEVVVLSTVVRLENERALAVEVDIVIRPDGISRQRLGDCGVGLGRVGDAWVCCRKGRCGQRQRGGE